MQIQSNNMAVEHAKIFYNIQRVQYVYVHGIRVDFFSVFNYQSYDRRLRTTRYCTTKHYNYTNNEIVFIIYNFFIDYLVSHCRRFRVPTVPWKESERQTRYRVQIN